MVKKTTKGRPAKDAPPQCVICTGPIEGYGHNAAPVKPGRCCSICNDIHVIPARLRAMYKQEKPNG
jgi:hypothetical protein